MVSDHQTSAEIIESCRQGDREAFRALYECYKDRVYSVAYYFFHSDAATAADATQQVFLKLFTQIAKYRGESEFSTWLYRFVVNVCIDESRRRPPGRQTDSDVLEKLAQPVGHDREMERAQTAASVRAAVASLPPKVRLAILLRYFDELSYSELATSLNCSMGTVASRLNRGHRLLAQKLAGLRDSNV